MKNKRGINRFDPFVPINMSSVGKVKLNETRNVDLESGSALDGSFSFMTANDSFKVNVPCVKKGFVVVLTKKEIGCKNDLGAKLMSDFVFSLAELVELPEHIIFMNEGIFLLDNENICDSISKMQRYGVKFFASMESIRYFNYNSSLKWIKQATSADITDKIIFSQKLINM